MKHKEKKQTSLNNIHVVLKIPKAIRKIVKIEMTIVMEGNRLFNFLF